MCWGIFRKRNRVLDDVLKRSEEALRVWAKEGIKSDESL